LFVRLLEYGSLVGIPSLVCNCHKKYKYYLEVIF
jgi:hypothetical protein